MDAMRSSRKRKQQPSSYPSYPLSGILNRSKSQIISGQFRPVSPAVLHCFQSSSTARRSQSSQRSSNDDDDMPHIEDLCKKAKQYQKTTSTGDENELSHILIKDLRVRRVYSPQSVGGLSSKSIQDVYLKESGEKSNCLDQKLADPGFGSSSTKNNTGRVCEVLKTDGEIDESGGRFSSEGRNRDEICPIVREYRSDKDTDLYLDKVGGKGNEETESPHVGFSCKAQNRDQLNAKSLGERSELQDFKHSDGDGDRSDGNDCGGSLEQISILNKEPVLTTPPDAEICGNLGVIEHEGNRVEDIPKGSFHDVRDTHARANADEISDEGISPKAVRTNDSSLKSMPVLRARLQRKLFKTPGSVNYRRLLSFLTNIAKNDSGTTKLDSYQKDQKRMDSKELKLPFSSQHQEASEKFKKDSSPVRDTVESGGLADKTFLDSANELSHGNEMKLMTFKDSSVFPMQLDEKHVARELMSLPSINENVEKVEISCRDKCLIYSKADPIADLHCVKDVANSLHNDDFKQNMKQCSSHLNHAKANDDGCSLEKIGAVKEDCILTTSPDAGMYGNSEVDDDEGNQVNRSPQEIYHNVKDINLTKSADTKAREISSSIFDKRNDSVLKNRSVVKSHLQRKLIKIPGSFSYRRLLPFLMDITEEDSGSPKLGHHQNNEGCMNGKTFQLPLSSQSQETNIDELQRDSCLMDDNVESNVLVDNKSLDPYAYQPKLASCQGLTELPLQLNSKDVLHKCLCAPSITAQIEKVDTGCKDWYSSNSQGGLHSDLCYVKNAAIDLHNDDFKQVQNVNTKHHNSESPSTAENLSCINPSTSSITFEHHPSIERGLDERKLIVSIEKTESVSRNPPEDQRINHGNLNLFDAVGNDTVGLANSISNDAVVLNHVPASNEGLKQLSRIMIFKNSGMAGSGGYKAKIVPKGTVCDLRMSSKGRNNNNRDGSEFKTTVALNPCSQIKLLKHSWSFSYRRSLPTPMNVTEDNFCTSIDDHYPKLEKHLDHKSLPQMLTSGSDVNPIYASSSCVFPMEHCKGNFFTQQTEGLRGPEDSFNDDSSNPRSSAPIPESQRSQDSCNVIQLQDKQVILNREGILESSPNPPIFVHRISSPITSICPIINEVISRKENAKSSSPQLSVCSEVKGNSSLLIVSNREKPLETDGCCLDLSQPKALEQLGVPAFGSRKGILKRNPRGCRGLCTCLNCTSFRLHAERAFEFSRNQLLDAEEVALDLIGELSHLRKMLEKSTSSGKVHPVLDKNQVEEACSKAFAAEKYAKDRLTEMNDELNTHCRITCLQEPRVRFSNHIEEKVIQSSKLFKQ